jgi:hypothetical protein
MLEDEVVTGGRKCLRVSVVEEGAPARELLSMTMEKCVVEKGSFCALRDTTQEQSAEPAFRK